MKKGYWLLVIGYWLLVITPVYSIVCGTHLAKKEYDVKAKLIIPSNLNKSLETINFIIYYTIDKNDIDCVRNPDVDNYSWDGHIPNTHPDYVDDVGKYLEHSLSYQVIYLGYKPPPKQQNKYKVLIEKYKGLNYWGVCDIIDGEAVLWIHPTMQMAYEYPNDDPEGVIKGALKITCAHELFHGVQAAYDWDEDENYNFWFAEATAVWMEDIIYDKVNDYIRYIEAVFHHPEKSLECCPGLTDSHRYGDVIFVKYLTEKFANNNIIKQIWEECERDTTDRSINAIKKVIEQNYNSTLSEVFKRFTICNYFKDYKDGNHPLFPNVKTKNYPIHYLKDNFVIKFDGQDNTEWNLPLLKFKKDNTYERIDCDLDAQNRTTQNINLLTDNINQVLIIPSNTTVNLGYQTEVYYNYEYNNTVNNNFIYPFGTAYILFNLPPSEAITRAYTLPNPAKDNIYFCVNLISEFPNYAKIEIYNIRGDLVKRFYSDKKIFQDNRCCYFGEIKDLSNGVYLFRIMFNGRAKIGKFVVIR